MSGGGNSVYSPLPQSNSDSNESSEEELHSLHESNIINRGHSQSKLSTSINNNAINGVKTYKQLDNDLDISVTLNGCETNNQHVTLIKPASLNPRSTAMSPLRECVFIFSILLCFFTIVVFLWVLPCDWDTCPAKAFDAKSAGWERIIKNLELQGSINIVPTTGAAASNLVVLTVDAGGKQGGVLALGGVKGDVVWETKLAHPPSDMDCGLLDTNSDGLQDCIIASNEDLLALHPATGAVLWSTFNNNMILNNIQFPLILPDLDGDNVDDLVTACAGDSPNSPNMLVIVSGSTGQVVGQPIQQAACSQISALYLEKDLNISFTCTHRDMKHESVETLPPGELFLKANLSHSLPRLGQLAHVATPRQHEAPTAVTIGSHRFILQNEGECPDTCRFQVSVKDGWPEKPNKTVTILSIPRAYAMTPVSVSFPRPNVSAFILKYWQWRQPKVQHTVDREMEEISREEWMRERMQRGTGEDRGDRGREEVQTLPVTERVVLIIFNDTNHHTVNASQMEVTLLCRNPQDGGHCQPQLDLHTRSMLVVDLDQDGSLELISFTSTYTSADTHGHGHWQLESRLQVVRLEQELHQFLEIPPQ